MRPAIVQLALTLANNLAELLKGHPTAQQDVGNKVAALLTDGPA